MPERAVPLRRAPAICALLLWIAAGIFPIPLAGAAGAETEVKVGAASSSRPGEIQLRRARFTVAAEQITVNYQLNLKGLIPIRDQLRDGARMTIEGGIRLLRRNLLRPNSELAFLPLAWNLRHDPLTREFLLVEVGKAENGQAARAPHLGALLQEAWKDLYAVLLPEMPLEDDETYIVRFDFVLKYAEVPPWLEKALFFWSWELSPKFSHEHTFTWQAD